MQETVDMVDDPEYEEEEPSFSDPEDFEDDIEDEGERRQEKRRLFGLLLTASFPCGGAISGIQKLQNWLAGKPLQDISDIRFENWTSGYVVITTIQ